MTATLVLLPGLDGTGELFAPFTRALTGMRSQIIAYPPDRPMSYAEHEAHARAQLPRYDDFVLLGESFSGPVAISIAAAAPPGLKGLILCASFASNPLPVFGPLRRLIGALPALPIPAGLMSPWLFSGRATAELRRAHARTMTRVSAAVLQARVDAVLAVDCRAQLARVAVPMLYLRAQRDRLIPASAGRAILELRADVELCEFDAPHFLLQTEPVACAQAVRGFAERCLR